MTDDQRAPGVGPVTHNVDRILDAHTHLSGQENTDQILECMNACGVEKAFVFAPMLNVGAREITSDNLDDIRAHDEYCADVCSAAPDRLLGFCTLNPVPAMAGGDLERAVDLMIEERCYHELRLRGAGELVPSHLLFRGFDGAAGKRFDARPDSSLLRRLFPEQDFVVWRADAF
jgi:hypothetical protein